jgi:hypothetical protein
MGPDWGLTSRGLIQIPKVEEGQLHEKVEMGVEVRNRLGGFQKGEAVPQRQGKKVYIYNPPEYSRPSTLCCMSSNLSGNAMNSSTPNTCNNLHSAI